jgi:hypothetical protein
VSFAAKVLADSISPAGVRLTTLEVTMPRIVLAEFNTHRMFSRNSASSRAIPVDKRIKAIEEDPFVPTAFGRNQKGMQAGDALEGAEAEQAKLAWLCARDEAVRYAQKLAELGVHKQYANRLLEPFSWHTVIVTATEWENFFGLRISPLAQPEIATPALLMKQAMGASKPAHVGYGDYHLPLVLDLKELAADGLHLQDIAKVSAARCARVSYLTHDGKRDPKADLDLFGKLVSSGHMSPLEHVARPYDEWGREGSGTAFCGNFKGWYQLRKSYPHEDDFSRIEKTS